MPDDKKYKNDAAGYYGLQVIGGSYHCYRCMNTHPFILEPHGKDQADWTTKFVDHLEEVHGLDLNKGMAVIYFGKKEVGSHQWKMSESCIWVGNQEVLKAIQADEFAIQQLMEQEIGEREN